MENIAEALKIAFGYLMFALALTLSISCFSSATQAVESITVMKDRETQYTYVEPSSDFNRIVGVETIVPTIYKAYKENFRICFYESYTDENNNEPLYLYTYIDPNGNTTPVNYIDLEKEILSGSTEAIQHLEALLGPKSNAGKYANQFSGDTVLGRNPDNGLYKYFSNNKFKELLGEYYQEDAKAGIETDVLEINKTKKRVITYILQ